MIQYVEKTSSDKRPQKLKVGVYKVLLKLSNYYQQPKQAKININAYT